MNDQEAFERAVLDDEFDIAKKFIEERSILPEVTNIDVWSLLVEAINDFRSTKSRNDIAILILEIGSQFKRGISVHAKVPPEYGTSAIEGKTPLHLSAIAGNSEMVKYCLAQGASVLARDAQKRTPLEVATEYKKKPGRRTSPQ